MGYHLQVSERFMVENGMKNWMSGYTENLIGPSISEHVIDADSYWDWLNRSGVDMAYYGVSGKKAPRRNLLVGDVQVQAFTKDGEVSSSQYFLHAPEARAHLSKHPDQYVDAARLSVEALKAQPSWVDPDNLKITFVTYNSAAHVFCVNQVIASSYESGFVRTTIAAKAIVTDFYRDTGIYIVDVLYVFSILYLLCTEGCDLILQIKLGLSEFWNYWNVWNVIDWLSISAGLALAGLWMYLTMGPLQSDPIVKAASSSVTLTSFDEDFMASLLDQLRAVQDLMLAMQLLFGATVVLVILKFFKSYRANPLLNVVALTFTNAVIDITHFIFVFIVNVLSFAFIGYALFGVDIPEFSTKWGAVETCLSTIFGEFDWYIQAVRMQTFKRHDFDSGLPRLVLSAWFTIYLMFCLLVLLNMLLGVILDSHAAAMTEVRQIQSQPIWTQGWVFMKMKVSSRGFIRLTVIKGLLEDETPAHPGNVVNIDTLIEAFPRMPKKQAEWIMSLLQDEARA
jgi:hypothetical protein